MPRPDGTPSTYTEAWAAGYGADPWEPPPTPPAAEWAACRVCQHPAGAHDGGVCLDLTLGPGRRDVVCGCRQVQS